MQRALILQRLGRLDDALEGYRRPLAAFRRAGDVLWEARSLCNRGVLQVYRGALAAAEADLLRAEAVARVDRAGARRDPGPPQPRVGRRAPRRRPAGPEPLRPRGERVPRARRPARAAADGPLRGPLVGAPGEPRRGRTREAAVAELETAGMGSDLAEARLQAAHGRAARRATRRPPACTPTSPTAPSPRQRRPGWAALARAAAARAAWMEAEGTAGRTVDDAPAGGERRGHGQRRATPPAQPRSRSHASARPPPAAGRDPRRVAAARGCSRRRPAGDSRARRCRLGCRGARRAVDRRAGSARARAAAARAAPARARGACARSRSGAGAHAGVACGRAAAALARRLARRGRGGRRGAARARGAPGHARGDRASRARFRPR